MLKTDNLYDILKNTKFPKNNNRIVASNNGSCLTLTFGITGLGNRSWDSRQNKKNEKLYEELKKFSQELDSTFKYTSITVNKNFKTHPHLDKNNIGLSMIIALGDFEGGRLIINNNYVDIKNNKHYFEGHKHIHSTEDFTGERYSIIYFNRKLSIYQ